MRSLLLCSLLSILFSCSYQSYPTGTVAANPDKQKFADRIDAGSTHLRSGYHYSWERTAGGGYLYKQYYPSNELLTLYASYQDAKGDILDGPYKKWYDNGNQWEEGNFENGNRQGQWKEYSYDSGHLSSEGSYDSNKKTGKWVGYNDRGDTTSIFHYKDGKYDGSFKVLNDDGSVSREGTYREGELLDEKVYTTKSNNTSEALRMVETLPTYYSTKCEGLADTELKQCSDKEMLMQIYRNIRYPALAREKGIEGTAIIRFIIDKEGGINDITVLHGLCDPIKEECERVVQTLKKWNPGQQNGVPVRVQFMLPIKFRLE